MIKETFMLYTRRLAFIPPSFVNYNCMSILLYPFAVLSFWYKDGFFSILNFCAQLNDYCIRLFSLPGLLSTYFRPLKNEYRKNLILFSILFGIVVKTFLIIASISIFAVILISELALVVVYLVFPFLALILLFTY